MSLWWGKFYSLILKSIQVSLWSHNRNSGVLLTNNCWLSHHRFVRCFIQQAENWPEHLPGLLLHECRPSSFDYFWQWQQGEAAWEAFSKDLLLNVTATVWPKSQIKHKLSFFFLSLFSVVEWSAVCSLFTRINATWLRKTAVQRHEIIFRFRAGVNWNSVAYFLYRFFPVWTLWTWFNLTKIWVFS